MKSTVENPEPTKAVITVEVDYEELEPQFAKTYRDISNQVNVPGFRKGHVPARIIDQRFGRGMVIQEVVNEVVPGYLGEAVRDNKLSVLGEPDLEVTTLPNEKGAPGGQLVFVAKVDVVAPFEIPEYAKYELEVDAVDVSDEDVQKELDELRARFATLKNVERPAQDADFLTIDVSTDADGEMTEMVSGISYQIGSGSELIEGLNQALIGAAAGDTVEFSGKPLNGGDSADEVKAAATVHSVKERELPEVDDDFAAMVSEFDTVDEMMADIRSNVEQEKRGEQALAARNLLLDKLLEDAEILLPETVVERYATQGLPEDASDEDKQQARENVESDLRRMALLDKLSEDLDVKVGQQEMMDFLLSSSRSFGVDPSQLFRDENQVRMMIAELTRTKSLVMALRSVTVKDKDGNEVDLSEFTRDLSEAEGSVDAGAADSDADGDAADADEASEDSGESEN